MNETRLQFLLDKYRDGGLSEEERAELERTLLSSPQARQAFWEHARFHALLAQWGQEEWGRRMAVEPSATGPSPPSGSHRRHRAKLSRWLPWLAAAAACLALFVELRLKLGRDSASPTDSVAAPDSPRVTPAGIAVLASAVEAKWAEGSALAPGAVLPAGPILLETGAVQVEFYSGARLIIQGPARVELRSEMEAFCHRGRLSGFVPAPARGFRVDAPGLSVIDLGTEFGLNVPAEGPPEVHVFTGAVEVPRADGSRPLKLVAGEAVRLENAALTAIPADRRGFLGEAELLRLAANDRERRQAAWQEAAAALSRDPATLAHFTFAAEERTSRTVDNRARGASLSAAPATIVGCGGAEGRWPESRAIEFRSPGDRIRLDVPGQLREVTLLAWVRIDALPNDYHALLAPDGLAEGIVRWGLSGRGELRLAIAKPSGQTEPNWEVVISPPAVRPERFGRWVLVATTFDGHDLCHFVDGEVVQSGRAFSRSPLVIGPAEVGNWRGPTPRYLQGRMDELAILSRALTRDEIEALYEAGRPEHAITP